MENIRTGYIPISSATGSNNQLSGCCNLSQVHLIYLFIFLHPLLFVCLQPAVLSFQDGEWNCYEERHTEPTCSQSVQHSKRESQETAWPGGFGLYTRHTLLRGDVHHCSTEGEPLPCLLSCSKVCCVASNTSNASTRILILGMPWGGPEKGADTLLKKHIHTHTTARSEVAPK